MKIRILMMHMRWVPKEELLRHGKKNQVLDQARHGLQVQIHIIGLLKFQIGLMIITVKLILLVVIENAIKNYIPHKGYIFRTICSF